MDWTHPCGKCGYTGLTKCWASWPLVYPDRLSLLSPTLLTRFAVFYQFFMQHLESHIGAFSFRSMCTRMSALELWHQAPAPHREHEHGLTGEARLCSAPGRRQMEQARGSLYLAILPPGRETLPWLLAHIVGSSLTVNTGSARCVADAQPWGSIAG